MWREWEVESNKNPSDERIQILQESCKILARILQDINQGQKIQVF